MWLNTALAKTKMKSSTNNESMTRVVAPIAAFLKTRAFRKKRFTFNRATSDGLVVVVNLQMGRYDVGNHAEIPGLRANLYGKFTVNLGVFVPELYREQMGEAQPDFVNEYDCSIRTRFSNLLQTKGDLWWTLGTQEDAIAARIIGLLESHGLPFLERFSVREDIIHELPEWCEANKCTSRALLDIALILQHKGRSEEAVEYFQRHLSKAHHPSHVQYCEELAIKHGWQTT